MHPPIVCPKISSESMPMGKHKVSPFEPVSRSPPPSISHRLEGTAPGSLHHSTHCSTQRVTLFCMFPVWWVCRTRAHRCTCCLKCHIRSLCVCVCVSVCVCECECVCVCVSVRAHMRVRPAPKPLPDPPTHASWRAPSTSPACTAPGACGTCGLPDRPRALVGCRGTTWRMAQPGPEAWRGTSWWVHEGRIVVRLKSCRGVS